VTHIQAAQPGDAEPAHAGQLEFNMTQTDFSHWRLEQDMDQVAWLTLDRAGERNNSLSSEVLHELGMIVETLENDPPKGLVLQSGKPGSFILGADVREFDDVTDSGTATDLIHEVHQLLNRIEALPFPTVAIIEGFCLGGGLELALAFGYRIAKDVDSTRIGFPEVQLGIYPGFGGSARAIRQCGALNRGAKAAGQAAWRACRTCRRCGGCWPDRCARRPLPAPTLPITPHRSN
jgi:3-hydroxyacyl-CoA dehydrogenase/enoyl-CoA hydratase/3-hydroxybutyryl-CoA epimerase